MKTFHQLMAEARQQVAEVSPQQTRDRQQAGAVVLDVREPEELGGGRVPGAIHIPRGLLELQIEQVLPGRQQEIVVHCAGGVRSLLAARTLREMGYANASSMAGGFKAWQMSGLPVE